jgi:uncharacterized protein YijF (DUF1287 family)
MRDLIRTNQKEKTAYTHAVRFPTTRTCLLLLSLIVSTATIEAQQAFSLNRREFLDKLASAAVERTHHKIRYEPAYVALSYPGGDVPADTGVCTDEVVRSYRALGIDLQKEVHEDMLKNFAAYPRNWGRTRADSNIDHRRVPNLQVFFSRKGESLAITNRAQDYSPGDVVTWDLGGGQTHIGIVVQDKAFFSRRHLIVHNIGEGPKIEDVLFSWKITGHYRYFGPVNLTPSHPANASQATP